MLINLFDVFRARKVVLPVIHVESEGQAMENAFIAFEAGADGIFLINHDYDCGHLLKVFQAVRDKFPGWWVGLNCLDLYPDEVFDVIGNDVNGVWVDNAFVDETKEVQGYPEYVKQKRLRARWLGLYFGGVAFKYQREVEDLEKAVEIAKNYVDVITTSGPGTGLAADVGKIKRMRKAAGNFPLAVASGITPENVADYLPYVDAFLVATGISKDFYNLEPVKVEALVRLVKDFVRRK